MIRQYNHRKGVTLLEILITIVLLSTFVLAVTSIDLSSHYHVIFSDRGAKLQNEISYTLEHMTKEISRAIGNRVVAGQNPIDNTTILGDPAIKAYIDSDPTGGPGDGRWSTTGDHWIAYRWYNGTDPDAYQIRYCPNCTDAGCVTCATVWTNTTNIISRRIAGFAPADDPANNYIDISITARWQPAYNVSVDNPEVTLRTRIKMPSVTLR